MSRQVAAGATPEPCKGAATPPGPVRGGNGVLLFGGSREPVHPVRNAVSWICQLPVGFPTGHYWPREKPRTGPGGRRSVRQVVSFGRRSTRAGSGQPGSGASPSGGMLRKPMRASASRGFGRAGYGSSQGARPWSRGASGPSGPQSSRTRCQKRQEGNGAETRTALGGGKALKGEPHERYRPSRSGSVGGSKPSRGWKTLKAERTGFGSPGEWTSAQTSL
jgi:hypothetical protein